MREGITFGGWLKQRRRELGVTQEELAESIGCSGTAIRKIEVGDRHPSGQIAQLLADYLSIPADEREAFIAFARTGRPALVGAGTAPGEAGMRALWRNAYLHQTNLPTVLTPLIGRVQEAADARGYLLHPKVRLLTLTGAPGIGKTRLALQVAAGVVERFEDGVFLVELAAIVDPDMVLPTVARTLGLKEAADRTTEGVLLEHVRERKMLLLLDNFEQVLDGAASVVKLMEASSWLKVLVTSREALHVRGERRLSVSPLAVPDPMLFSRSTNHQTETVAKLASYPSVQLFIDRVQDVSPDFELTHENAADVAIMCIKLEGLPLAIELAAARANHFSLAEMRAQLDNRLKLLTGGGRDLPARQRTLREAIAWSYDLLDRGEQTLFRSLGVFVGGCTLAAMQAINEVGEEDRGSLKPALEVLQALEDKNLVRQQARSNKSEEVRFGMLEGIREYALERLIASGVAEAVRQRHARYFLALVREVNANKSGPRQAALLARLDAELDNLRSALDWLLDYGREDEELTELALHMVIALFYYWDLRGYFTEGREWLERTLENGERNLWCVDCLKGEKVEGREADLKRLQAMALNTAGLLAWDQSDNHAAQAFYEAGLTLRREVGDKRGTAASLNNLALLASDHGRYEDAIKLHEEALALRQEFGNKMDVALSLNNLGVVCWNMGDANRALAFYEESLALYRELGNKSDMVLALDNLGMVATNQEDYAAAREYQEECLAICRALGHKNNLAHVLVNTAGRMVEEGDYTQGRKLYAEALPLLRELGYQRVIAKCFQGMAAMCYKQDRHIEAARLWGVAEGLRQAIDHPMGKMGRALYERRVASAREQVGSTAFESAWVEGRAMPLEEAVGYALAIKWVDC